MIARKGWAEELATMLVEERKEIGDSKESFVQPTAIVVNIVMSLQ